MINGNDNKDSNKDTMKIFDMIQNSTLIENVNRGLVVQTNYFGAKAVSGMAYNTGPLYNKPNTVYADMTKPQSNVFNSRS